MSETSHPCVCKTGVSVIDNFFSRWSKDKLMCVTLVLLVLCKQKLVCGLEMDLSAF